MEVLAVLGAIAGVVGLDRLLASWLRRRERARVTARLRAEWGRRKPEAGHDEPPGLVYRALQTDEQLRLDEQTWIDLELDRVFDELDRTESSLGREMLYARLRARETAPIGLAEFEETVERFRADENARLAVGSSLAFIGRQAASAPWPLLFDSVDVLPEWIAVFPLLTLAVVTMAAGAFVAPRLLVGVLAVVVIGLILKARLWWHVATRTASFRAIVRMQHVAREVIRTEPTDAPATVTLRARLPELVWLGRLASWIGRDPSSTSGEGLLQEYLNLLLCLDGSVLWLGFREVGRRRQALRDVAFALGGLDAALAVASVRDGRSDWTRPGFLAPAADVVIEDLRHPLVTDCVANSLQLGPRDGLILTGANMTGKSTFLRGVGVNVVLGQTLNTVFAARYAAPWFRLRSCINPSDDLATGKSLYRREAETMVSIMAEADSGGTTLCLVDELFRGTNSGDRIAATQAILRHLAGTRPAADGSRRCCVLAATHDLELVPMLADILPAWHFGDEMGPEGPQFDFSLRQGPATSRNAIALLAYLGAPADVVAAARAGRG